tara:strand:- start:861 stop:1097 length:237 start_codon:yes stop_codon:yes gene_type:complete
MHKVRVYMAATGRTLVDIANHAGMDPAELRRIASGKRKPGRRVRQRIAHAMGITLQELDADMVVFASRIRKSNDLEKD